MIFHLFLFLSLQPSCEADCLEFWFRNQFDRLSLLPSEIAAEALLRFIPLEQDQQRRARIAAKIEEMLPSLEEQFPIAPLVLLTDSLPGQAMLASANRFNAVSLQMRLIEIQAKTELLTSVERWQAFQMPQPTQKHKEHGESVSYFIYYRVGMQLYDQLMGEGRTAEANLHLVRILNSIETQNGLADFHQVLTQRMQTGKLTPGFLAMYRSRLGSVRPMEQPQMGNWVRIVYFWKLLLESEARQIQPEFLAAIEAYLRHSAEAPPAEFRFAVTSAAGTKYWGDYWPNAARAEFEKILATVDWTEGMAQRVASLGKLFVGVAKKQEERPMTAFWSRPHSAEFYERYADLRRTYRALSAQGAWEPKLGLLLEDLKKYGAKDPSAEDILLDFLERARIYQGLLGLSGVDGTVAAKPENAAALQQQLQERPPHFAKRSIILAMIDLLESAAGRKVYQHRRLLWLGVLDKLRDEAFLAEGEVLAAFRERARASANDIIRYVSE